ncbi:ISAs1 family transposase [Streptomyces sp. SAI-124]|uniref:ISAs1 family transposase n=1 Tax=Streptomyces sp. SAI-124 TaxID=3377730 RepID=UPI003C7C697B
MLVKLGSLDTDRIADLRPYFDSVPDPARTAGPVVSLTAILLVSACAVVSGARSMDELAEWGQRASNALLSGSGATCSDGGTLRRRSRSAVCWGLLTVTPWDRAVGALPGRPAPRRHRVHPDTVALRVRQRRGIAVDGKALKGSARLTASAGICSPRVTHGTVVTLAQVEVGAKTNETTHFRPLLAPLDLTGTVVTFDALHSVKANISWLVETRKAHYIAVIKTNQPTAYAQLAALPWQSIAVQHTASGAGHGRRESRSIKTCGIADELGAIAFPHAPPGHPRPPPPQADRPARDP